MLKKRRVILIISIVLLGFVLSLNLLFDREKDSLTDHAKKLEEKLDTVVEEFDEDYIRILMNNRPDKQVSFVSLNTSTQHPFYLFSREGDLVYWSDISMVPEFEDFSRAKKYQLIENNKGVYFSRLRKLNRSGKEYWVLQVYPLYDKVEIQNDYLNAGENPEIFGNEMFLLSAEPEPGYMEIYHDRDYLFSALFREGYASPGSNTNQTILIFFFSLLGLVLIIGSDFVITLWRKGRRILATLYTAVILGSIRMLMLIFNFPKGFFKTGLFNPNEYASSIINPSLGDLLLNVICFLIVFSMLISILGRKRFLINFIQFRNKYPYWLFLFAAYLLSTALMWFFFSLFSNIVQNAQWNLNIQSLPTFDYYKGLSLLIIFLGGAGYLLFSIIGLNMVLYKNQDNKSYPLKILIYFSLPFVIALSLVDMVLLIVFMAHLILLVSIVSFQLYDNVFKLGLNTFLTFFFGCLVGAVITGTASYQNIRKEEVRDKQKFANYLLIEEDVMAEFLLSDIIEKIQNDIFIRNRLADPFLSKDPIEQKVRKIYLTNFFDQFSQNIFIYNRAGESFVNRNQAPPLDDLKNTYMNSDYATGTKNLYFVKASETGSGNRFLAFINIYRDATFLGTVFIELTQQRMQASSVFPKLLLDRKYAVDINENNFDYAVFREGVLQFSSGVFNYRDPQMYNLLDEASLYQKGIVSGGYHHFGVKDDENEIIISSSPYPANYILADIAFFFVSYLIFTMVSISVYLLFFAGNQLQFNYATKLQLYLNFAFFFPMLVISIIAVGFLSHSYTEDLHRQYYEKATIIRDNLNKYLDGQFNSVLSKEEFVNEIYNLSSATGADINIYLPNGLLMATNQPAIFEKKILTTFLHPRAYATIIEAQENRLLQTEQVGRLSYKTAYLALRDRNRQRLQAIIAIPFFQSEEELNELIAEVFSNILIIFVVMFLLFLVISYFVSRHLTYPFKLLTQKLKSTNLDNNEFMNWPAKDEIGLLVNEYNNMLFKLEASKKVLASNEKESAWREMAKQVAHEIKNPLTPMKLTLQHLLRLQSEGKLDRVPKLQKPIMSLIHQVDTLSDIATSFSAFAKMPLPENRQMDLKQVVVEAVELFCNREDVDILFTDQTPSEKGLMIMGDVKLFGRVISNLIINGIQAVEKGEKAEIRVNLSLDDGWVKLEIRDNGKGISEELREKVFLPNFSTKSEGSGLGLAIAKRGVETAGGRIWFVTKVSQGTSFYLTFPLIA
ncbi:ATP-binding protein [Negadavirga shengliensis]|uniref:histidine kinase n=1 Tax=Negadavirga shengliensis TaxID=1389218 RepID=A0ABV9SV38_9BACT